MATSQETSCNNSAAQATLAKALAPEEVRPGDFVTLLHVIAELPSFWWSDEWNLPREEPVRICFTSPCDGLPLKVMSVCLPFVLVKNPAGQCATLDLRRCRVARLAGSYAKRAWKFYKKADRKASSKASQRSCC